MIEAIIPHLVPKPYRLQLLMPCAKRIGKPMDKDNFVNKIREIILPQKSVLKFCHLAISLVKPGDDVNLVDEYSCTLRLHPCTNRL